MLQVGIFYGAVVRGDLNKIKISSNSVVLDRAVIHAARLVLGTGTAGPWEGFAPGYDGLTLVFYRVACFLHDQLPQGLKDGSWVSLALCTRCWQTCRTGGAHLIIMKLFTRCIWPPCSWAELVLSLPCCARPSIATNLCRMVQWLHSDAEAKDGLWTRPVHRAGPLHGCMVLMGPAACTRAGACPPA